VTVEVLVNVMELPAQTEVADEVKFAVGVPVQVDVVIPYKLMLST
jgi:hypothetical protein